MFIQGAVHAVGKLPTALQTLAASGDKTGSQTQNLSRSLAPGPVGDVALGPWLLGKGSTSPMVVSGDTEVPGGSLGTTEPRAPVTRGDTGSSRNPGASEHSLFETPPAWENICPANGATRKSLGAGSENHFELPTEGLGFNTFSPICRG